MSSICYLIVSLVLQVIMSSQTLEIFPLTETKAKEVLEHLGEDVTDVEIMRYIVDAKSTIHTGQAPSRDIFRVFIDYEKDFEMRNITILLKAPFMSPMYNFLYKYGVYEKEYLLYSQVFPEMRKLDDDPFTAKYYFGNELLHDIAMEDLYAKGYKRPNITQPLNLQHCQLVFKYLAKMHALSVVLNDKGLVPEKCKSSNTHQGSCDKKISEPETEDDFYAEEIAADCKNAKNFFTQGLSYFIKSLDEDLREKYSDKLETLKDTITDRVGVENANGFKALIHGNMWSANMLFKYRDKVDDQDGDVPEKVAFINFEGSNWGNPVFDILYVVIGGMKFEDYEEYFESLLEMYSSTMNDILQAHGLSIYKLEDLKSDIHKNYGYAMWLCGVILPMVSEPENLVDLSPITLQRPGESTTMAQHYDNQDYKVQATKWFRHFVEKGAFDE